MRILEVNNTDLAGKRFNGYDLQIMINNNTVHKAKQLVFDKCSEDKNVVPILNCDATRRVKHFLSQFQKQESLQMMFLPFAYKVMQMSAFKKSDIVHYHLIHNEMFSLGSLPELFSAKPSIWTIHDPWILTGHCIYPRRCKEYLMGCRECKHLNYAFPLEKDNASKIWDIKKAVLPKLDVDIIVASKYMEKLVKTSPLGSSLKRIHHIPFGIDLNVFKKSSSSFRKKYKINNNEIVVFFRAQDTGVKGIEYIREALKQLDVEKDIVVLTCNDVGLMDSLKNKYRVIDHGWVNDDLEMVKLYNTCDIFLMPSTAEAFGLMAIEAMACEKPTVVFEGTSLPEVTFAPEYGVVAKLEDSKDLMRAIKSLIDNPKERATRSKIGRGLAIKYYDIEDYHKKILSLYEKVYKRRK